VQREPLKNIMSDTNKIDDDGFATKFKYLPLVHAKPYGKWLHTTPIKNPNNLSPFTGCKVQTVNSNFIHTKKTVKFNG